MRIGVFTLPKVLMDKDPNMVINDRYAFKDGRLEVVEPVAVQIERVMSMYECKLEWVQAVPNINPDAPTGSLAKVVTQSNVKPLTESKLAKDAEVHAKPVEGGPKSVTQLSVEDGAKIAEAINAESETASAVAGNVAATVTKPA